MERTQGEQLPEDDCLCCVCYSLLLEPTTLNCGHTICRGCLAGWYLSTFQRKCTCPICRQNWEGYPQVNTTLRSVIERVFSQKVRERQRELEGNPEYKYRKNLDQFEKELKQWKPTAASGVANLPRRRNFTMIAGVAVACVAVLVMSFLISWARGGPIAKENTMPLATWDPADVAQWLVSLGWARHYSEFAYQYKVDGRTLQHMDVHKLMELLNVTDGYHKNAFELAVVYLRESGVRMPQTMWEYKALYPERSLHLSLWMKDAPRCTTMLLYLFFYDDVFLPFLHTTVPRHWDEQLQQNTRLPSPTWAQFLMFWFMMLAFPYGMMGLFAWSMRSAHTVSHLLVIVACVFQTVFEFSVYSSCFVHGRWRLWKQFLRSHAQKLMVLVAIFLVCHILVPNFVISIFFYCNFYLTPVGLFKTLLHTMFGLPN